MAPGHPDQMDRPGRVKPEFHHQPGDHHARPAKPVIAVRDDIVARTKATPHRLAARLALVVESGTGCGKSQRSTDATCRGDRPPPAAQDQRRPIALVSACARLPNLVQPDAGVFRLDQGDGLTAPPG